MANMSYCRFRNTLLELQDCYNAMVDEVNGESDQEGGLSIEESRAQIELIELCQTIIEDFGKNN